MDKHGDTKGFTATSRAWYSFVSKSDEIMIGFYSPGGGTSGEFAIRWHQIGNRRVPRLEAYDDAWSALANMPELIAMLGQHDDENMTVDDVIRELLALGYRDRTEYERAK